MRLELLLSLPSGSMDRLVLKNHARELGSTD
jgi:hypothetical protein